MAAAPESDVRLDGLSVALFGPAYPFKGGIAQHTTALAHHLDRAGAEVVIHSWRHPYPEILYPGQLTVRQPEMRPFDGVTTRLRWNRPDTWWAEGRASRHCALAVFAHVVPFQSIPYRAVMAGLGSGPSVSVICHNVLPHERLPGDRLVVRAVLDRADRVVVHSPQQADLARQLSSSVVVTTDLPPHFPDAYVPRRPEPGVHKRLLFFGMVRPYKGLDVLIRALAAGPPDVRLRVAGEAWRGTASLEALSDRMGVRDRVEFRPGYVDAADVPGLFADVDAVVLPYREATGSQGVWTAFQFGVPAVVTRTGGLPGSVREGVDGLVAEPGDVATLAAAIEELYRPGRAEALRRAVRPVDPDPMWDAYIALLTAT